MSADHAIYPRRPKVFVAKYLRELLQSGLAADRERCGPEVLTLLAVVASYEDTLRYSRAPDFYNTQLALLCGFGSEDKLDRVRRKAIDAGLLRYKPGRKGVPGKYWVLMPWRDEERPQPADETSAPVRRQPGDFTRTGAEANGFPSNIPPQPRGGICGDNCGPSIPSPVPQERARPERVNGEETARRSGSHTEATDYFSGAWAKKYGEKYLLNGGKDGAAVKTLLEHLGGDVGKFRAAVDRYLADDRDELARDSKHPIGIFRASFSRWAVDAPRPVRGAAMTADQLAGSGLV